MQWNVGPVLNRQKCLQEDRAHQIPSLRQLSPRKLIISQVIEN